MCCLFGLYDYGQSLSARQKSRIISALAVAAEARGTDAAGIAYLSGSHLSIYKRPLPAHRLRFRIPASANVVMGHTRMTTQGSEHWNYNNHPFYGQIGSMDFALAHNGVLRNDRSLQVQKKLPVSKIETDSYVIVQLLEQAGKLDLQTLRLLEFKPDAVLKDLIEVFSRPLETKQSKHFLSTSFRSNLRSDACFIG